MKDLLELIMPINTFMPHGYCFLWRPSLLWLFVISHALIALAYFSIPLALDYFLKKRTDIVFKSVFRLFSIFILACGITHVLAIVTIWHPIYFLEGLSLAFTAGISMLTAIVVWPLIPKALQIPSQSKLIKLNAQLQEEIAIHKQTKTILADKNADLDNTVSLLKASNDALKESEQRFKLVVNLSPAAIYTSKLTGDIRHMYSNTFVSDGFEAITGYTSEEWYSNRYLWINNVHREDLERLLDGLISLQETGELDMQYRFMHKDGNYRWVHDKVKFLPSEDGSDFEVMGAWMDITESKQLEEEMRLAAITFDSLQGIMVTDAQTQILRVNAAFCQITGYSSEEVIGKRPTLLRSGIHDDAFYENMWERLDNEGRFEGEVIDRRKDGSIFTKWQSITALSNSEGQLTNYVSMFTDISEKKKFEEHIKQLAFYDPLTNLANRRLLETRIEEVLVVSNNEINYYAVLFLDLDHFKRLNDSLGHHVGDQLLKQVANRLRNAVHPEDTVARLGGDEFVILLDTNSSQMSYAASFVVTRTEKIIKALNESYVLNDGEHYFSASIGVTIFANNSPIKPEEVLQQADIAMYRSKAKGRNLVNFFDVSMQEAANAHLQMDTNLRVAMESEQFSLYYQPQVDSNGKIVSVEALIRRFHPTLGNVSPMEFIPIAEDNGMIHLIGRWVIKKACQQIHYWTSQGYDLTHIAVNVSARQIQQTDFVDIVAETIRITGIKPSQLMLELTESSLIDNVSQSALKMNALKKLGVTISIDDFGTGYSSLAYLTTFPLNQLKIDRSFVQDVTENKNNQIIVGTIIQMANSLGLKVVAEGVETQEQMAFLLEKGCTLYQGYLFSPAVSAEELAIKWLSKQVVD